MLGQSFAKKTMSRNRFELLLRMFHFSNNEEAPKNDRLGKIRRLVDFLNHTFAFHFTPDECLCVDESMIGTIPWAYNISPIQQIKTT